MKLNPTSLRKSINKAYLKVKPNRTQIETFKTNILEMFDRINENESEEFHKNILSTFLKNTWYDPNHYINTKGRNDLVIHNGKDTRSPVGVLMEAKKPSQKTEMPTINNLNSKAFQELMLYYLRERITGKNLEIKYLIATNLYEWFIFNATEFERLFAGNKKLVGQFTDFEEGRLPGITTDFFYKSIAEPFINQLDTEISFTYVDIRDYKKIIANENKQDDNRLVALFKLFTPEHLLKLPFANDSNSLDKGFYNELLHIIGLKETKDGSKKLIGRKPENERVAGALLENTITILQYEDCLSQIKASQYGITKEEQLYAIALELVLTWINRILFLKLLEGQLVKYNGGEKAYKFLNAEQIPDYDALNRLFFQVLAIKEPERIDMAKQRFSKIPYLNSSLFEPTDLEQKTIRISNLEDEYTLPVITSTVLKDRTGKRSLGKVSTLQYLFSFLDAYDFSSEGSGEIQEENKMLINASILGLIFEKINGYKDGSFFTPGFITMYMCHETIRRAVVQKFNEAKGWNCETLADVYDKIESKKEANSIINSLKICDPAVGSGHFLVSALNEIIAIKSELKILLDHEGKTLRDYHLEVVNDELVITDEEGELFEYKPLNRESQRVQETLFHEKQTIIENCLFGVDINPNSVKICRLRLWIELLKNAYYKPGTSELETLPNIDINIKCGNSLISRFALDTDMKKALRRSKWTIDSYRIAVMTYRNAQSKEQKRSMEKLIGQIKNDFEVEIATNDKRVVELNELKGKLFELTNQSRLFEQTYAQKAKWNESVKELTGKIEKFETQLIEIKNNKIFENAFEWRFEFPEVLNDDGDFMGFDVVIGNPPYIRQEELSEIKPYLQSNYPSFAGMADLYVYFVDLGDKLLVDKGNFMFILPNKWLRAGYGKFLRGNLAKGKILSIVDFGDLPVFEEATTYPCILSFTKITPTQSFRAVTIDTLEFPAGLPTYIADKEVTVKISDLQESGWTLNNSKVHNLLAKIRGSGIPLGKYVEGKIFRGVLTGFNEAFVINKVTRDKLIAEDPRSEEIIKSFLAGRDIKRYQQPFSDTYLILFKNGQTKKSFGELSEENAWNKIREIYPAIANHLERYVDKAKARYDKGQYWWELRACDYYEEFEKPKIAWPETSLDNQFALVDSGLYLNKTTFFIPFQNLGLMAILNSSVARFFLDSIVSKMRGGYYSLSKAYVETLPIPILLDSKFEIAVSEIITIKSQNPTADTTALEKEIDRLVYELYELTEEEIRIVEGVVIK
jgi:adenine-specific DNA-methyltransferase